MKESSFDTFEVREGNREAFETCRAIAALHYQGVSPVLLLGVAGTGKSHLLWSIVKHVRAHALKAGLGLVLAREFPEKVRHLIQNPAPIQQGKKAILLVDELEQFQENASDLEKVVDLFHQNRHVVVIASNVHPDRLDVFSTAFKILVGQGRLIEITHDRASVPMKDEGLPENKGDELAALQAEVETLRWERFEIERKLSDSVSEAVSARKAEFETLRRELEEAKEDAASALAEQARLQGLLGVKQRLEETLHDFQEERDALRGGIRRLEEKNELLQAQITAHEEAVRHVHELGAADSGEAAPAPLERRLELELAEAHALADAFQAQLEHDHQRMAEEAAQIRTERDMLNDLLEEARAEQGRISILLEATRGRMEVMEAELEKARKHLAAQTAEMDALRHSAAAQVASATIQTGEMENRLSRFESILDAARQTSRATEASVQRISEELFQTADTLKDIARRHAVLKGASLEPYGGEGEAVLAYDQIPLFDAALLDPNLPGASADDKGSAGAPAFSSFSRLNEMVERALYPDDTQQR